MEIKKVALTFGITILFALFIVFLVDAIYEQPKYDDFCNQIYYPEPMPLGVQSNCIEEYNNQTVINECIKERGEIRYNYDKKGCPKEAYCDYCSKGFTDANAKYNKNIFYISAILGLIAIISGLYLPKTFDTIASGFVFGGILVVTQGTFRVFGDLNKISRVIILGIELIILIWMSYKKVKDKK